MRNSPQVAASCPPACAAKARASASSATSPGPSTNDRILFWASFFTLIAVTDQPKLFRAAVDVARVYDAVTGGTRALCRGRKGYCTEYTFSDGTPAHLALMPVRVPDKSGRRRVKWLVFVVIHLDWSAQKVAGRYRRRFGIESTYRQLDPLRARTTSRNPALRFFLLGLGFLLLNIWVMLRFLATRLIARGPARWDEHAFRLFRFIVFLRRAIEHALGTTDSIPIYSC